MSAPSRYRALCAPIIARVLRESQGMPEAKVQARLHAAYPFGERVNHPYKIWCQEIRAQGGPRLRAGRPRGAEPPPVALIQPAKRGRPVDKNAWLPVTAESWHPPKLRCRHCAHLGANRPVTDHRGATRVRRECPCSPLGFTDIDWPACAHFQARDPAAPTT